MNLALRFPILPFLTFCSILNYFWISSPSFIFWVICGPVLCFQLCLNSLRARSVSNSYNIRKTKVKIFRKYFLNLRKEKHAFSYKITSKKLCSLWCLTRVFFKFSHFSSVLKNFAKYFCLLVEFVLLFLYSFYDFYCR